MINTPRFLPDPTSIRPGHSATAIGGGLGVILDTGNTEEDGVKLPTASTDLIYGVTAYTPGVKDESGNLSTYPASPNTGGGIVAGRRGDIIRRGLVPMVCGGTVTAKGKVMCNSAGKIIDFVAAAGNCWVGYAQQSGVLNDVVEVELEIGFFHT